MKRFVTFITNKGKTDVLNVTRINKILFYPTYFKVFSQNSLVPSKYPLHTNRKALEDLEIYSDQNDKYQDTSLNNNFMGGR